MAKTQKNKATSYHLGTRNLQHCSHPIFPNILPLGQLKAKLAKLKRELLTPSSSGGGAGIGFDVARTGVASVYVDRPTAANFVLTFSSGFIGFPSVGKSTLMSRLTGQHSEAAAYEFTTVSSSTRQASRCIR